MGFARAEAQVGVQDQCSSPTGALRPPYPLPQHDESDPSVLGLTPGRCYSSAMTSLEYAQGYHDGLIEAAWQCLDCGNTYQAGVENCPNDLIDEAAARLKAARWKSENAPAPQTDEEPPVGSVVKCGCGVHFLRTNSGWVDEDNIAGTWAEVTGCDGWEIVLRGEA